MDSKIYDFGMGIFHIEWNSIYFPRLQREKRDFVLQCIIVVRFFLRKEEILLHAIKLHLASSGYTTVRRYSHNLLYRIHLVNLVVVFTLKIHKRETSNDSEQKTNESLKDRNYDCFAPLLFLESVRHKTILGRNIINGRR